jgi:DNA topoisomerase VI subunit A
MIRILDICHELLIQNVTATKRDIYYKDVKLFGNSQIVDLVRSNNIKIINRKKFYISFV